MDSAYPSLFAGRGVPLWRGDGGNWPKTKAALQTIAATRVGIVDEPPDDSPGIPAGYTYLGQLVAHDLTFSALPAPEPNQPGGPPTNLRTPGLDLDCIYGNGPAADSLLYEPVASPAVQRSRLRLPGDATGTSPPVDFARLAACPVGSQGVAIGGHDALVADVRNDIHLILSQLTLQFMRLHNNVVTIIEKNHATKLPENGQISAAYHVARQFVIRLFRSVVVHDYLPRILDSKVYEHYFSASAVGVDPGAKRIPVEYLLGAARCGHAMSRREYAMNSSRQRSDLGEILNFSSMVAVPSFPIGSDWTVDWRLFFEIDGSRPQLARRFTPYLPVLFTTESHEALMRFDQRGLPVTERHALGFLDMARCWNSVPSGQECARQAMARCPGQFGIRELKGDDMLPGQFRHPQDPQPTVPYLADALRAHPWFMENTPLSYYLLQEAAVHRDERGRQNGACMGPLGSYIIAATIRAALPDDWQSQTGRLDMATLLAWANASPALEHEVDAFVQANAASTI